MSELNLSDEVWFVLGCTSPQHELKVRDDARCYGLRSFVPLKYDVKKRQGHDRRVLVPALSRYIFVKGSLEAIQDYIANAHFVVYLQRSTFSGRKDYLTIPSKAMDNFIAITENNEQRVTYFSPDEIRLNVGDQIRIKGGLYDGREGTIMRIKGKRNRHLVVQIPGILIAAVQMSPDMIELLSLGTGPSAESVTSAFVPVPRDKNLVLGSGPDPKFKSKNVDSDKKMLFELTHRLLFEFSDKYKNENEYYLLLSEMRRARARLASFKGYTPATEAELALPLFMAAVLEATLGTGTNADVSDSAEGPVPSVAGVSPTDRPVPSAKNLSSGPDPSTNDRPVPSAKNLSSGPDPSTKLGPVPSEERLRKAVEKLKGSSLLRVKCQMYLAVLAHDGALLQQVQAVFADWHKAALSVNQRALIDEFDLLTSKQ